MTDERIVELYFERSESALKETEKAYGRYFHYVAYCILRDDEDAKEIVNDTYMKAWNEIPPARPKNLKAFLGCVARQLSINRLEKKYAEKRGGGEYFLALDELSECVTDDKNEGERMADSIALKDALNRFLRELPTDARRVFIRRYWHMDPISDIAKSFGMSESRVKSMLKRTRDKLKKKLSQEGIGGI